MPMSPQFTYLIGALLIIGLWSIFYYLRKDLRREMVFMSCAVAALGVIMEALFWTKDWWQPQTLTGTTVGIEDFLFGFGSGGVSAVMYEEVFRKRYPRNKNAKHPQTVAVIFLFGISILLSSLSYFVLGFNSAAAWMFSISVPVLIMWYIRPDLIADSLFTGVSFTIVAFIGFFVLNYIDPGFVERWWLFEHLTNRIYLGVPLEDVLWFFTAGMFIGPFYEFWQGKKLVRMR